MRLLKLESKNPKFKTIDFQPGLNIVVGRQLSNSEKKTINGLGKSLSLSMIHYMLGAGFHNPKEKKLKAFLANYGAFSLHFEHEEELYKIDKNFAHGHFFLNGRKFSLTDFKSELNRIFLSSDLVSFRRVFNCFARRYGGSYYVDALSQQGRPLEDYDQRFVNLHLLGIDTSLVLKRNEFKSKINSLISYEKALTSYGNPYSNQNVKDLRDKLKRLERRQDKFEIAKNYDELKKRADDLTKELDKVRDTIDSHNYRLSLKRDRLKDANSNIEVDPHQLDSIFEETKTLFPSQIKKRFEDAANFHKNLLAARKNSLFQEIEELDKSIKSLETRKAKLSKERDSKIKILDKKGALEEYKKLGGEIDRLKDEIGKIEAHEKTLAKIKKDKTNITLEDKRLHKRSIQYIEEISESFEDRVESKFRSIVKRFYDNHGGALGISDAERAKYLFNIDIDIPKDSSEGIGEVKIFCYDILLFLLNPDLLGFLAHDSHLFSGIDQRQRSIIFNIVLDIISKSNLQYFVNLGVHTFEEIVEDKYRNSVLSESQRNTIKDGVVLELLDSTVEGSLFGETFN